MTDGFIEYRDVVDFPGYRVGNDGSVWSRLRLNFADRFGGWRRKACAINRDGYAIVNLRREGKTLTRKVHQLVLEAFVGPRPPRSACRHLDGNRTNNDLRNLCWGTYTENQADKARHGTLAKGERVGTARLTAKVVRELRRRYADGGVTMRNLAEELGVSESAVRFAITRRSWAHIP